MLQLCPAKSRAPVTLINVPICALLLLGFILSPAPAFGQSTYGAIIGTVKDSSGSAVPGATVKITNTDENTTREVKTNSTGDYELLNVQPAHYTVSVTQSGFQTFAATDLLLV